KQISIFSVLGNGTGLNARVGLAAESGEPLGSDGNITFSLADSQTGETAYRESFAVKSSQFAPDYAWFVPFSQVGKVIYRSTGNATLGFTAPDAKIFSATFNRIALPSLSGQETIQWFDSRFLQSATTVEQSQTKGYFNVTLVKIGNWTHPKYLFWGPLVTVFRVDLTVTNIATQTENLWPSY